MGAGGMLHPVCVHGKPERAGPTRRYRGKVPVRSIIAGVTQPLT